MELLGRIERFLRQCRMSPTRFGREAVRDPRLVWDMRKGRTIGARTARRIEAYLAAREGSPCSR